MIRDNIDAEIESFSEIEIQGAIDHAKSNRVQPKFTNILPRRLSVAGTRNPNGIESKVNSDTLGKIDNEDISNIVKSAFNQEFLTFNYFKFNQEAKEKTIDNFRLKNVVYSNDRYSREVKADWYIKYRTVRQNLRNVTFGRQLMSYLNKLGMVNAIKKVK
jgi:hypothetical protein